jgi:hypothetical protein
MTKLKLDKETAIKFLDFEIDKTQQTFFESGKVLGSALLTYLLLLCLTLILLFGNVITTSTNKDSNQIKIPFLDLTVNKPYASWMLLTLCDFGLYWFVCALANEMLMARKLYSLLNERYKTGWYTILHLRYPSIFSIAIVVTQFFSKNSANWINYALYILSLGLTAIVHLALNVIVNYRLVIETGWQTNWSVIFPLVSLFSLILATVALTATYNLSQLTNEEILERMILPEPNYEWDKKRKIQKDN